MTSKAVQKLRINRRVNAGKKRKRLIRKIGTTPSFSSVFGTSTSTAQGGGAAPSRKS